MRRRSSCKAVCGPRLQSDRVGSRSCIRASIGRRSEYRIHRGRSGGWCLATGDAQFDVIVVTNYLHRPLFPALTNALAPGGLLIYETFAAGNAEFGKPSKPDYLLRPRELLDAFGADLRVLAFEDGFTEQPKPAMVQRITARKADPRATLAAERCRL